MRILIVDDDPEILDFMQDTLVEGFQDPEIIKTVNGAHALHLCSEKRFDLICTDYHMPVMNGMEFVRFLRREAGPNQYASVIVVSGYLDEIGLDDEKMAKVYFVEKPAKREHLLRVSSLALATPVK